MDLRAGSPAAERGTRPRSLRGPILARPASSCAHDDDRLRFPPVSPAQNSQAGKKESTGHHLNQPCQPCARPSSNLSLGYHRNDARTAKNGFATSSGVSKSAKVVLDSHAPVRLSAHATRCPGERRALARRLRVLRPGSPPTGSLVSFLRRCVHCSTSLRLLFEE